MTITNPQVIQFTNEQVRVLAEEVRDLKIRVDAALVTWYGQISANCPNDVAENLDDGRDAEGVSRLTGADINSLMGVLVALQADLDAVGVEGVVSKPCVRVAGR